MGVRVLQRGGESLVEAACRAVGIEPATLAGFLSRPETLAVIAEDAGVPVGLAYGHELAHPDGRVTVLLYSVDVAEAHRGQGHGTALVEAAAAAAIRRGAVEMWVLTEPGNDRARAAYEAAGGTRDADQAMYVWHLSTDG